VFQICRGTIGLEGIPSCEVIHSCSPSVLAPCSIPRQLRRPSWADLRKRGPGLPFLDHHCNGLCAWGCGAGCSRLSTPGKRGSEARFQGRALPANPSNCHYGASDNLVSASSHLGASASGDLSAILPLRSWLTEVLDDRAVRVPLSASSEEGRSLTPMPALGGRLNAWLKSSSKSFES
jgi:hypothetical protein